MVNIISWVVFGLLVGAAAHYLDPKSGRSNLIGTMVLGILGALAGGFLGDLLFGPQISGGVEQFNLSSFIIAVIGALVLLFVNRAFFRKV